MRGVFSPWTDRFSAEKVGGILIVVTLDTKVSVIEAEIENIEFSMLFSDCSVTFVWTPTRGML